MDRKVRFVQYGCGKMGKYLMRYGIEKGGDLVGAFDMNPALHGKDVCEVIGDAYPKTGIKINDSKDAEAILSELKPDVCIVATRSTVAEIAPIYRICAKLGINAISTCEEALYPWNSSPALTAELDELADNVVYTGAIDAYFNYSLGELQYRSVRFENELLDKPSFQGNAAVNYTDAETPWTRIIEHKWFEFGKDAEGNDIPKTVISREYSSEWKKGDEPYYPVNDEKNGALYAKYKELAEKENAALKEKGKKVVFGGRLGEYKYYDMDAVIARALEVAKMELGD